MLITRSQINTIDWQSCHGKKWGPLRWKEIFSANQGHSNEFVFGYAELKAGEKLPLHTHPQAETAFIVSGSARVQLGKRRVELEAASALYFPSQSPHAIEVLGTETLGYIYTYACEKMGQPVEMALADEDAASRLDILNNPETRWAVAEDFEPWRPWEPSKGLKGIQVRWLLGPERGNCKEVLAGTFKLSPGTHYTLHHHDGAEIYYGLSGRGVVYLDDAEVQVHPGSAIYVGSGVVHGADALGAEPLRMYWLCGNESPARNYNWTPVEDIYTQARRGRQQHDSGER